MAQPTSAIVTFAKAQWAGGSFSAPVFPKTDILESTETSSDQH